MAFELRLLRCALAVAEHRNFGRAAKSLRVTQPTMSRSIQELEVLAGTRLFDRFPDGVQPTDAGALFLQQAKDLLTRASDLEREMDLLRGVEKGELRIGSGTFPSSMYVDRALARLLREHPAVHVSVANENWATLLPLLRKRELDLAIIDITAAEADPEMRVIKLENHQGYFVMRPGHPVLKLKREKRVDESFHYPFVTTARFPTDVFKRLAEALVGPLKDTSRRKVLSTITCESLAMMKTIVMGSDAISILPVNVVFDEVRAGKLAALPAPDWVRANFGIVHLAHRSLSPVAEEMVRLVQEADAELLKWEKQNASVVRRMKH